MWQHVGAGAGVAAELSEGGALGAQRMVEEALTGLLGAWGHRVRSRRASHPDDVHVGLMHVQVGGCVTSACTGGSLFMSSATRPNSGHGYKNISAPNNMLPNDA